MIKTCVLIVAVKAATAVLELAQTTMPWELESESSDYLNLLQKKVQQFPWSIPFGSVIIPDIMAAEKVCMGVTGGDIKTNKLCAGEVSQHSNFAFAAFRSQAWDNPVKCMQDKLPEVLGKMCQMCSVSSLDGFVFAGMDRGDVPCANRFTVLQRLGTDIKKGDISAITAMRQATAWIERNLARFPHNWDAAYTADGSKLLAHASRYADIDYDGKVDEKEFKDYIKTIYIFADMAQETLVAGNRTGSELAAWTSEAMQDWVGGGFFSAS